MVKKSNNSEKVVTPSDKKTKLTKQKRHTVNDYKKAIKGSLGIKLNIANKLGITRGSVTLFMNEHPELLELLAEERENSIDTAEEVQFKLLNFQDSKSPTGAAKIRQDSSKFLLNKLRKEYADKTQVDINRNIGISAKELYDEIKREQANNQGSNQD